MDKKNSSILRFFRNKNLKYGVNSVIVTIVVVAIAVVVNLLVGLTDFQFDLTPTGFYTLGPASQELLSSLDKEVEIIGLFDEVQMSSVRDAQDILLMLDNYRRYPNITIRFVDTDRNPGFIRELDPYETLGFEKNDFVVRCGTKIKRMTLNDMYEWQINYQTFTQERIGLRAEEVISGAILYVAADKTPIVYFIEGHEELELNAYFTALKKYLQNNNYLVETMNLTTSADIPKDAEMLVFASPKLDLNPNELDRLRDYFYSGGKAMFLFDYYEYGRELSNFNTLFETFNIAVNNDKVREGDERAHLPENPYFIAFNVPANTIIPEAFQMLLTDSRSISMLKNTKPYITPTVLLSTSASAVSEPVEFSAQTATGPLDVAVAVEYSGGLKPAKIVVMGNASFISDDAVNIYSQYYELGQRMFLYSMRWMLGEQETLVIESKRETVPMLTMTAFQVQMVSIAMIAVLPLLIMGSGFVIYLKRRHL